MSSSKTGFLIRTLIISFFISLLLLALLTLCLSRFRLPEPQVHAGICGVYIISCLAGGFLIGKLVRCRRFFWGFLAGGLYFLILFAVSCLQDRGITSELPQILRLLAICAASGMIGGMLS